MGRDFNKRPIGQVGGIAIPVETVTLSTAAQTLTNEGLSILIYGTSGVAADAILPKPPFAGIQKTITVDNNTSSVEASVHLGTTGSVFYGTTYNTAVTATSGLRFPSIQLTAVSTVSWAVTGISSTNDWTFSKTTGSTGQA